MSRLSLALLAAAFAVPAAAQNAATLVSASAFGNLNAAGVVVTVSGDANRNASVALESRLAGGVFAAAHPLARVDATHFAGSLFWLSPGQSYDARVTLSDPEGTSGTRTRTVAFATRADTLVEPTLRTLHVATTGNDSNAGTDAAAPLRTIQHAADLARSGDLVLVEPGVYRETVNVPASGTAAQPIVFRGNGGGVVLDGADGAIEAGVAWTPLGSGVYSRVTGFATGHVVSELGRLFRYSSLSAVQGLAAGAPGGFYFDGSTLFVKFMGGSSPAAHTMYVARREDGFVVDGRSWVRIEGFEIRHYGASDYGKGVYLRFAKSCMVRQCLIHEVEAAGVWVKGGQRHRIEDNEIWDTSIVGWPWDLSKGSYAENNAIRFTDNLGRGHVVRRNVTHGTFDGIAPCGSAAPAGGLTSEVDVYENTLSQHNDDAVESDGYCSNVRLWSNTIHDVHMGFSVAPANPGPVYILRNVVSRFGNTRTSQQDGYMSSALKINNSEGPTTGLLFLYHNTFWTDAPGTDAIALLNPGTSKAIRLRNNVIAGSAEALYKVNPVTLQANWDDLYTTDPGHLVYWMGTHYATLAAAQSAVKIEVQGLSAEPQLQDPAGGDFTPGTGSPLIDRGLAIPGINDGYRGSAPDIGAVETAGP